VTNLEETALEEAGHTTIRDYFGAKITEVAIGDGEGHCDFRARRTHGDLALFQNIAGCLAGKVAADRGGFKANDAEWHASKDYRQALDCALRLNAGDEVGSELLMAWMERRTLLLVDKLWPQIHKLAFALLDRSQLTGEEVRKLVSSNGKPA
jgi:hypothetical protein